MATVMTYGYRGMRAVVSTEGICPIVEISLLERNDRKAAGSASRWSF